MESLSVYLDIADSGSLPNGWKRYVQFSLGIVNQIDDKYSVRKGKLTDELLMYSYI